MSWRLCLPIEHFPVAPGGINNERLLALTTRISSTARGGIPWKGAWCILDTEPDISASSSLDIEPHAHEGADGDLLSGRRTVSPCEGAACTDGSNFPIAAASSRGDVIISKNDLVLEFHIIDVNHRSDW